MIRGTWRRARRAPTEKYNRLKSREVFDQANPPVGAGLEGCVVVVVKMNVTCSC